MSDVLAISKTERLHAERSGKVVTKFRRPPTDVNYLAATTVLIYGPAPEDAAIYRIWADDLGGTGIHVLGEGALLDWLERNVFAKALVVIDDSRPDRELVPQLADEIRQMRPNVPVIVVMQDGQDTGSGAAPLGSFTVEYRPMTKTGFIKAIQVSRLLVDFEKQTSRRRPDVLNLKGDPEIVRGISYSYEDDVINPHTGWWMVPLFTVGIAFWGFVGIMVLS